LQLLLLLRNKSDQNSCIKALLAMQIIINTGRHMAQAVKYMFFLELITTVPRFTLGTSLLE